MEDRRGERLPFRNESASVREFARLNTFLFLFVLFYNFLIIINYGFSQFTFSSLKFKHGDQRFVCLLLCLETLLKQGIFIYNDMINCLPLYQIIIQMTFES